MIDALDGVTTTTYDPVGNVTSVTDSGGQHHNLPVRRRQPADKHDRPAWAHATYQYDADSRMISTMDRDGRTRTFSYDADDRLTTETWYDASNTIVNTQNYTYDADGNRLTARDNNGSYTYTYDALNRVISVQEPFGLTLQLHLRRRGQRIEHDRLGRR